MLDLFSGIGGFSLAFEQADVETVAFSEIEPFPCRVLAHRWPDVPNLGDITKATPQEVEERVGRVDLISGGFPCQDLSVAGKRAGLAGSRSGLFWKIVELAGWFKPSWVVLENVPGLLSSNEGRDFAVILDALEELGYGVAWRVLDAQYFGVPQRRRRVFVVCRLGAPCPPEILFEPEGGDRDIATGREAREVVAALTADGVGTCGADDNQGQAGHLIASPPRSNPYGDHAASEGRLIANSITARYGKGPDSDATEALVYQQQGTNVGPMGSLRSGNGHITGGVPFVAHALTAEGHDASEDGTGRGTPLVPFNYLEDDFGDERDTTAPSHTQGRGEGRIAVNTGGGVRRLTPLECERLQGFPDGWTAVEGASDSARYRALGNAVAVPVVEWIARRLMTYEKGRA